MEEDVDEGPTAEADQAVADVCMGGAAEGPAEGSAEEEGLAGSAEMVADVTMADETVTMVDETVTMADETVESHEEAAAQLMTAPQEAATAMEEVAAQEEVGEEVAVQEAVAQEVVVAPEEVGGASEQVGAAERAGGEPADAAAGEEDWSSLDIPCPAWSVDWTGALKPEPCCASSECPQLPAQSTLASEHTPTSQHTLDEIAQMYSHLSDASLLLELRPLPGGPRGTSCSWLDLPWAAARNASLLGGIVQARRLAWVSPRMRLCGAGVCGCVAWAYVVVWRGRMWLCGAGVRGCVARAYVVVWRGCTWLCGAGVPSLTPSLTPHACTTPSRVPSFWQVLAVASCGRRLAAYPAPSAPADGLCLSTEPTTSDPQHATPDAEEKASLERSGANTAATPNLKVRAEEPEPPQSLLLLPRDAEVAAARLQTWAAETAPLLSRIVEPAQACGCNGSARLLRSHLDYWAAVRAIDQLEMSRQVVRKQRRWEAPNMYTHHLSHMYAPAVLGAVACSLR